MDRLETRELAYFVAVAEELHFGRAADRLGIAQPPLSRTIKQLERRLGVRLLERGSRGVTLTAAGEVLLRDGRQALDAVAAAAARTRRAGRREPRLILVLKPCSDKGLLPEILAAFRRFPEAVPVDVRTCGVGEQSPLLRRGEADVAILHGHRPDLTGLDCERLLVEPQLAVLPRRHRLATRGAIHLADLRGETMPLGNGAGTGDAQADPVQVMQLIALGQAAAVVPESVRTLVRRDLVCVPVVDAPPTPVLIAWAANNRSRAVAAFVRTATAIAGERVDPPAAGAYP